MQRPIRSCPDCDASPETLSRRHFLAAGGAAALALGGAPVWAEEGKKAAKATVKATAKATGGVALIVGTWLTLINQADIIVAQGFNGAVLVKIAVNYLTPFIVSNIGLLARKT